MAKYKNVISLGFFCSPASELERIGLRNASYPFDWLISDLSSVIDLIDTNFEGFLEMENLYQHRDNSRYYFDNKFDIHFFHDFNEFTPLELQISEVKNKYDRRIKRFYKDIVSPTLFVRYIKDASELEFLEKNYEFIKGVLKKSNEQNEIILICNSDLNSQKLDIYYVEKDENDNVARTFLEKNSRLVEYLTDNESFSITMRNKNIEKFLEKQAQAEKPNLFKKISKRFKRKYKHNKIIN